MRNFLISKRLKVLFMHSIKANSYLWRTTQQQEIDYIEEVSVFLHYALFKLIYICKIV
jgi:uncharacterized protein